VTEDNISNAAYAISLRGVSKSFGKANFALREVSLDIDTGAFLCIVGTSGSGKTTLLKLVNRLIEPSTGRIEVDGEEVTRTDPVGLRRRIGYVFQGVGLFPHLNVAENIAITPKLLGWSAERRAARVRELLDLVRLPQEITLRYPDTLSGGQSQRVGVARALAAGPKIMLMDEPFGAVDQITRSALSADYRELHDRLGLTTVMVTHDVVEAVLLADRIAIMVGGAIVEEGTPHTLLSSARSEYARELMALPRRQAAQIDALRAEGRA